jgi:acetolactate synthase small subunit
MHKFHIHYRNTQGTLMRILAAVSRRGIEMPYVLASSSGLEHRADLLLDVNAEQIGQLSRDWHAIVDVVDVRVGVPEMLECTAGIVGV